MPVGAPCSQPSACPSGHCVGDGSSQYCTRLCDDSDPCPDGYACSASDPANKVCVAIPLAAQLTLGPDVPKDDGKLEVSGGGGCSTRPNGPDPSKPIPWLAAAVGVAALAARRRARR